MAWRLAFISDPFAYYAAQVPAHALSQTDLHPQALSLAMQMGNVMLLLALLAVVCCWTPHGAVSRGYLLAVAVADWGHIYATYATVGADFFWDVRRWNDMVWGNVGVSVVLNVLRLLTVAGAFGPLGEAVVVVGAGGGAGAGTGRKGKRS